MRFASMSDVLTSLSMSWQAVAVAALSHWPATFLNGQAHASWIRKFPDSLELNLNFPDISAVFFAQSWNKAMKPHEWLRPFVA